MYKPYDETDLEDILRQIRGLISSYKKDKHELSALQCQDIRDDLSTLFIMLSDIASDIYGYKIEAAAKYDSDKAKKEEELEDEMRRVKTPNVADRVKRIAKIEVSEDNARKMDKMNKLTMNLCNSLPHLINSIASRIHLLIKTNGVDVNRTTKDLGHEEDNFPQLLSTIQAERALDNLEKEIHD